MNIPVAFAFFAITLMCSAAAWYSLDGNDDGPALGWLIAASFAVGFGIAALVGGR